MPRHPTARKVHREEHDEDTFVAGMLQASGWARTHARALLIGGAAVVVLVLGGLYYLNYRATMREQAATRLNEVRQTFATGNAALVTRDLAQFLDRFGDTPSAAEARILLAQVYLQTDSAQKAVQVLRPAAEKLDEPIGPAAALLLGAAFEQADQRADAERVYLRVGQNAPYLYQRIEGLDRAAILRMQAGNGAAAAELYRRILDEAPEELPRRPLYELRLGEAQAMAETTRG